MTTARNFLDLFNEVHKLIAENDPVLAERFSDVAPRGIEDQVFLQNRFWRSELGRLSVNTISERECLIDEIDPRDWLRHFRNHVLPTIVRFKLPA